MLYLSTKQDGHDNDSGAYDIVSEHRQRNRGTHPPRLEHFTTRTIEESSQYQGAASQDPEADDEKSEDELVHHSRAPRNSKTNNEADPTTLRYYPGHWRDVQIHAKKKMQRHVVLYQGFPTRENDLDVAGRFIVETLTEYEAQGKTVENGMLFNYSSFTF